MCEEEVLAEEGGSMEPLLHLNDEDTLARRTCLSVLVCSVVFFFWTILAFLSTFMAYSMPRSGPRTFRTRNTFPYAANIHVKATAFQ
jgi:Na+-transporting methylmalonyl-CoA/oxaloacetate decarboxylase gamma subunit